MLKTILSISGKPGLYKLISQGKNMLVVESLTDRKRLPVYANDKAISLGDIAIYSTDDEIPLYEVLTKIKENANTEAIIVPAVAETDKLRKYFREILPNYDEERVYPSDIRKLLNWYNLLIKAEITDFSSEKEEEKSQNAPSE